MPGTVPVPWVGAEDWWHAVRVAQAAASSAAARRRWVMSWRPGGALAGKCGCERRRLGRPGDRRKPARRGRWVPRRRRRQRRDEEPALAHHWLKPQRHGGVAQVVEQLVEVVLGVARYSDHAHVLVRLLA